MVADSAIRVRGTAEELLGGASVLALSELESGGHGLRAAYEEAEAFAAALPRVSGYRDEPWDDLARALRPPDFGAAPVTALTLRTDHLPHAAKAPR